MHIERHTKNRGTRHIDSSPCSLYQGYSQAPNHCHRRPGDEQRRTCVTRIVFAKLYLESERRVGVHVLNDDTVRGLKGKLYAPSRPPYNDTTEMKVSPSRTNRPSITGQQPSHRCTPPAMRLKDKIAACFMDNASSHTLIPVRANLEIGTSGIVSSQGLIGSFCEARVIDVVLHLIRAQGRVVRQEARTRSCCQVRWCRK